MSIGKLLQNNPVSEVRKLYIALGLSSLPVVWVEENCEDFCGFLKDSPNKAIYGGALYFITEGSSLSITSKDGTPYTISSKNCIISAGGNHFLYLSKEGSVSHSDFNGYRFNYIYYKNKQLARIEREGKCVFSLPLWVAN